MDPMALWRTITDRTFLRLFPKSIQMSSPAFQIGICAIGHRQMASDQRLFRPYPVCLRAQLQYWRLSANITSDTLHHPHGEVRRSIDVDGPGRTIRAVPTEAPTDKYAVGSHDINNGGLDDDVRSREQRSSSDKHGLSKSGQPVPGLTNNDALAVKPLPGLAITKDYQGTDGAHDWKEKQQAILAGVVNLNNTVDTDRDTTVAPGKL